MYYHRDWMEDQRYRFFISQQAAEIHTRALTAGYGLMGQPAVGGGGGPGDATTDIR